MQKFLFLGWVHNQVVVARILADDHAFVNRGTRGDEQLAALFQAEHGVGRGAAAAVRHQRAAGALGPLGPSGAG